MDDHVFEETAKVGFQLKRKGITVPLADLIIAVQCFLQHLILIEKDRHYEKIKECLDLNIYSSFFENETGEEE